MNGKSAVYFALALTLAGTGCSSSSSSPEVGDSTAAIHALYNSDVAAFANIDGYQFSVEGYDIRNNQLFTSIFGGTDAASVEKFYQDRIHYAFTEDEIDQGRMTAALPKEGWLNDPSEKPLDSSKGQIGAINVSTSLWLQAAVEGTTLTLMIDDQTIPIDSTRTGIMMFGSGYSPTISDSSGNSYPIPPEYRQAILVHEARHSDCTGGLSSQELQAMRSASTATDLRKQYPLPHCGHSHILCTSGPFEGIPACDAERYGAYTVGAVYLAAVIQGQTDDIATKILQMAQADYETRFISVEPTAPDEQRPNMTSAGLTP